MPCPIVDAECRPGDGVGNPYGLIAWHGGVGRPTGNPGGHADLAEPLRDIEGPQSGQSRDERIGIVAGKVTVHPVDHLSGDPGRGSPIGCQAPQEDRVGAGPERRQAHAEPNGRPTQRPTGEPHQPPHHPGNPPPAGKPRKAGYGRHASGMPDGEIERGKSPRRPAGGDHRTTADKLLEGDLEEPGKQLLVEIGCRARRWKRAWMMAGKAQRDPRLGSGVDEELGRQVERGQDAVEKDDGRPMVIDGEMHVSGHGVAVDMQKFATDDR